jgi:hypothetical protein
MKPPRFHLAGAMTAVAVLALNLGAVRALYDEYGELLLLDALPAVNLLAVVGFTWFRRRRAFALGFMAAGALSVAALLVWIDANFWTFLRYFEPPAQAVDHVIEMALPNAHMAVMYVILIVAFAIPHAITGLAGGYLLDKVWSMIRHRKRPDRSESGLSPTPQSE